MADAPLTFVWRPSPQLRATAIGILRRDDRILVSAVTQDTGQTIGWRPLGGGIEFGERAEETLTRELHEEIGATVRPLQRLGVLENLYTHEGVAGHEIVFVIEAEVLNPGQARPESFIVDEGGHRDRAAWVPVARFRSGAERLLPEGLLALV